MIILSQSLAPVRRPKFLHRLPNCAKKGRACYHDVDHRRDAVLEDLRNYSGFVTPSSYFIVEYGIADVFK